MTATALVAVAAVSWALLAKSAAVMSAMSGERVFLGLAVAMMEPAATVSYLAATALMWAVMMVAMMAPAVLPVVLVFQRLERGSAARLDGALFAAGYLVVWVAFGLAATVLQWALHRAALLHDHFLSAAPALAGVLLVAAGMYQLTPLKSACLEHCQSPLAFLLGHWRDGRRGALLMGMDHGRSCTGCCWALMLLMFVGGTMSVTAMAVLSVFILAERLLRARAWIATAPGIVLLAWGCWTLVEAWARA